MARMVGVAFGFFMVVLLQCAAAQTVHVVGDGMGWSIPTSNGGYTNWASSKNFAVGDILLFNFATNTHDVVQVTKASYDACTATNYIGDVITAGPTNITLDTAGEHYYICTFSGHCQAGQKLAINVSSSAGTPRSSPAPPTTPTTPSTSSPTNNVPTADCPTSDPPIASGPRSQNNIPRTISPTSTPPIPASSSSKVLTRTSVPIIAVILGLMF